MKKQKIQPIYALSEYGAICGLAPHGRNLGARDRALCAYLIKKTSAFLCDPQNVSESESMVAKQILGDPRDARAFAISQQFLTAPSFYDSESENFLLVDMGNMNGLLSAYALWMRNAVAAGDVKLAALYACQYGRLVEGLALNDYVRQTLRAQKGANLARKNRGVRLNILLPQRAERIRTRFLEKQKDDPKITVAKFCLHELKELYRELRDNSATRELAATLKVNGRFISVETVRGIVEPRKPR
jgi:hypothetical protein